MLLPGFIVHQVILWTAAKLNWILMGGALTICREGALRASGCCCLHDQEMLVQMIFNSDALLDIYKIMVLARRFQEEAIRLSEAGKFSNYHAGIGQEAVGIGCCYNLTSSDILLPHYRGVASLLVRGFTPRQLMAGFYAKATSPTLGRTPLYHIGDLDKGVLCTSSLVGSIIPFGAGSGLTTLLRQTDEVTLAIFGDGAANRGDFHEGLNLAAIWKLPVVFVCENNFYSKSTPMEKTTAGGSVWKRAASYGIPGELVDGNDVEAVGEAMQRAVTRARSHEGPSLLECQTFRWNSHSTLAKTEHARTDEELVRWKEKCPIKRLARRLIGIDAADEKSLQAFDDLALVAVADCVEFAETSAYAAPEAAAANVYR
jgi:TPP-dependent pyruvate/acetoin dehydrogenase alpha subunit